MDVHGGKLICKHCGHNGFAHRRAQLNTAGLTLFDLDFLNKSADVYACKRCGFLHWFLPPSNPE
ncbi:MAG: hypothetical protein AAGD06_11265 [Acidobacteriota bacterium]